MKRLLFAAAVLTLMASVSMAVPMFDDGGWALQKVMDDITVGGPSSVVAATDYLDDAFDSYWAVTAPGTSATTLVFKATEGGYENLGTFGVYDAADSTKIIELYDGAAVEAGDYATLSIMGDGSVVRGFYDASTGTGPIIDTGIDFAGKLFGYYFDTDGMGAGTGGFWYSDTGFNADMGDHMAAYRGMGDTLGIPGFKYLDWNNSYLLAWEIEQIDLADKDYDDFVIMVESVTPIPEPTTLVILGLGSLGLLRLRKNS